MQNYQNRLAIFASHVVENKVGSSVKNMDDVVIVTALRTPMTKAKRGKLKDTSADELVKHVLKGILENSKINPSDVGDIVFGSVLGPSSQRANELRIGAFMAGFPETVPVHTVNRQCSSGLQAIASVAASIKAGYYNIGIAGGVETMSINPMTWEGSINPNIQAMELTRSCLMPMGITSENVAAKFGVSRETQDLFAVSSHNKAFDARLKGKFKDEIVTVYTHYKDKDGKMEQVRVYEDDGIRENVHIEDLSRLRPAFKKDGTTTAGNSSQVTDGASAILMMTRKEAMKRNMEILGVFRSFSAVGVDPAIMGIGPAVAIPDAVKKAGLTLKDIDLYELNEAFASQATYCIDFLKLDPNKVNVNGGAIALGHPLGMTGARCTATLLHEMKRNKDKMKYGVVSMCIGSGMGAAAVFELD